MSTTRSWRPIAASLLLALALPAHAQEAAPPAAAQPAETPVVYDEKADANEQIAAALAKAKKENRRVLIQWGGNWCGWCIRLHTLFDKEAAVRRKLMYEYDVVHVDIGQWNKHMDLAEKYGANLKQHGVPFLTILDADGNVVANQETGSLEAESNGFHHDPRKVVVFLTKHQAPYPEAQALLDAAIARAKDEEKMVFLHFGAPWCGWCHRLEDWMAREEVWAILGKEFIDLKIDVDRCTGTTGKSLYAKMREGRDEGIPWFAFLDAQGQKLATSTGPNGNVGFPYEQPEIAHFIAMLEATAKRLSKDDLEALRASLAANKARDQEARSR